MNPTKTEYKIETEERIIIEAFQDAVANGTNINWVKAAPIHPRTTAPLTTDQETHEVIAEIAALCESWPEDETTLYWNLQIPETDTLIDPLKGRWVRNPGVAHLQPPPEPIVKACQQWYNTDDSEIDDNTGSTSLLKGFFIKTTINQDGSVTSAELLARYTEPSSNSSGVNTLRY